MPVMILQCAALYCSYLLVFSMDYAAFPLQPYHSVLSNPVKREPVVVSEQFVFRH